jgi:hypothetical protein
MTRLHDEQTVNGLGKTTWASVFRLKQQQNSYLSKLDN